MNKIKERFKKGNLVLTSGALVLALFLTLSLTATAQADNLLGNYDFSQDFYTDDDNLKEEGDGNFDTLNNWLYLQNGGDSSASMEDQMFRVDIDDGGSNSWSVQLLQAPIAIEQGYKYGVKFDAKASKDRELEVKIGGTGDRGWAAYNSGQGESGGNLFDLSDEMESYDFEFVMGAETDDLARFEFQLGADTGSIWIDNVELYKIGEADTGEIPEAEKKEWVYDKEFFFIFNLAVGGNWPGYPDETTEFPQQMEVDYIRVLDEAGELEWSDEFDGDDINEDYWTYEVGHGHEQGIPGWGNNELQYYTEGDNAWIEDDKLVIEAREEEISDQYGDYDYTSTRMITKDKVHMEYGRVEIKAKMPEGQGIWPALWMLGADIEDNPWPGSGEIDLMEYLGQNTDEVHGTIHGPNHSGGGGISGSYSSEEDNFNEQFHVFAFEWEEDEMRWYVDGNLFHKVERTDNNEVNKVDLDESEETAYTKNQVVNGDFSSAIVDDMADSPDNWYVWAGEGGAVSDYGVEDGEFKIDVTNLGNQSWAVQFAQLLKLTPGDYQVSFEARADEPRDIIAMVQEDGGGWTVYGEETVELDAEMQEYIFDVSLDAEDIPKLIFLLGATDAGETTTINIDNVKLEEVN